MRLFILTTCLAWISLALAADGFSADSTSRPNVLWITSEDNGPQLGCYGDAYADTPNLDRLTERGLLYRYCWSNAPVCAPARTTIISGLYPPSTGSQHMRSMTSLPQAFQMYPQLLRAAGYYCTNNSKEDYNLQKPGQVWDESSGRAHWKNRAEGQPFFAIFNHTVSHESQLRKRPHKAVHDPRGVRVPAYHPDTPEVRQDWAQYYDKLTEMDALAGRNLAELEAAGLADDTIIFYYGDHGSGMPRSKRWPYNSGLHVPLIVYIPEKFKHLRPDDYTPGGNTDRLVSFVDLAPTLLSLCGIEPPDHLQGHAFAGPHTTPRQPYIYGFRGRMDERFDMVRSLRDERYIYIRNYMPHKPCGQFVHYMFQTPTTQVWKQRFDEGRLNDAQSHFWKTKPAEELYDLQSDPDEVINLVDSPEHRDVLAKMRSAHRAHVLEIRDLGFLPEGELHRRSAGSTPYEMGHNDELYPLNRIMAVAELAASFQPEAIARLEKALNDDDSAVRYWSALGLLVRGTDAVSQSRDALHRALGDDSPYVRIAAAEALGRYGDSDDAAAALPVLLAAARLDTQGIYVTMSALNAIDELDERAAGAVDVIRKLPRNDPAVIGRMSSYVSRLVDKILNDIQ